MKKGRVKRAGYEWHHRVGTRGIRQVPWQNDEKAYAEWGVGMGVQGVLVAR